MVIDHCICIKSMFSLQFLFCPQSWKSCPQFRKSEEGRQKWPILAAKKVGTSANFFLFSLNPYCHVLFAKNGVQIGQILLLWPHFYFTSAYRGSPPCTLSHYPDNRETGYSNVLGEEDQWHLLWPRSLHRNSTNVLQSFISAHWTSYIWMYGYDVFNKMWLYNCLKIFQMVKTINHLPSGLI